MCNREQYDIALSFWTASFQFLVLVENAAGEIDAQGNTWEMVRDFPITETEYDEATRWSDHTVIIPLLFNLLHAIEMLIKGFLLTDRDEEVGKSHDIIDLTSRFLHLFPDQTVLNDFFHRYTCEYAMPEILKQFLKENGIDVRSLYQSLRYPSPDFQVMRTYRCLKYRGRAGCDFFTALQSEIKEVRKAAVALARSLEPKDGGGQCEDGQPAPDDVN